MMGHFTKLFLVFTFVSFFSACKDEEEKKTPVVPVPVSTEASDSSGSSLADPGAPVVEVEKPKESEEVIDLSWVPKSSVSCKDKKCIPSVPLIFVRPTSETDEENLRLCMGVLVDEKTVVTSSAGCLPSDVAEGKVSCKSRIFLKFPSSYDFEIDFFEEEVGCESIEKFSIRSTEKEEKRSRYYMNPEFTQYGLPEHLNQTDKFKPNFMVIKLTKPIKRTNYSLKKGADFRSGAQYTIAKVEGEKRYPKSRSRTIDYKLTSQSCPTIENSETRKRGKNLNVVSFDCDLYQSSGAPIFDKSNKSELSFAGILDAQVTKGYGSSGLSFFGGLSTFIYKVYLGFSYKCLYEMDCSGVEIDDLIKGDLVEEQSEIADHAQKEIEKWAKEEAPLRELIQWEVVGDLLKYQADHFFMGNYPTSPDGYRSPNQKFDYKGYGLVAPIPKCVKTMDFKKWVEAYLTLEKVPLKRQFELQDLLDGGQTDWPIGGGLDFQLKIRVRKEYAKIGASNFTRYRKFNFRPSKGIIGKNGEMEHFIKISNYEFGADNSNFRIKIPLCDKK